MKQLEIGDILYGSKYGSFDSTYQITRVTAKRAFAKVTDRYELQFNRECKGTYAREIGGSQWGPTYYLETEEIKAKWHDKALRSKLQTVLSTQPKWPINLVKDVINLVKNSGY